MSHRVSLHFSNNEGGVDLIPLLEGQLEDLPPLAARVVRVFISSTFSDMIQERNALMEKVYPKLKHFCREYRLEFQSIIAFNQQESKNALKLNKYKNSPIYSLNVYTAGVERVKMIDLRWGLREESQDNHTIMEFCIKEIENCLKTSVGPSFVALLGQKYGFRSFPSHIPAEHFEMIRGELVRKGKDVSLLTQWFEKDTNVLPHVYTLQPISAYIPNYTNKDDDQLREKAESDWNRTFQELHHILRMGVMYCWEQNKMSPKDKDPYYISITEYEIDQGMIKAPNPQSTSFCFSRSITNLKENIHCKRAAKYIDIVKDNSTGQPGIDVDAQQMLNVLRSEKIPKAYGCSTSNDSRRSAPLHAPRLGGRGSQVTDRSDHTPSEPYVKISDSLHHFNLTWHNPEKTNPTENEEYLKKFCETFEERMQSLIRESVDKRRVTARNSQASEIHQHLVMCKARSQLFRGREEVLNRVRRYLSRPADYPLVLHGLSGSGKTSVLAKSASMVKSWLKDRPTFTSSSASSSATFTSARGQSPSACSSSSGSGAESYISALNITCNSSTAPPAVIVRFLGTTALCCSIRLVLGSLCWHIASLRGLSTFSIPGDYPSLVNYFHDLLQKTTASQPLVLILDSLDQLSPAHRAHNLAWLPRTLSPHVHILLSTLPYEYDLLDTLQLRIPQQDNFIKIDSLGQDLSVGLVREWLRSAGRDLTPRQCDLMKNALSNCSLPLYTRLVFEEVCRWSSYAPPDTTRLEYTVKGIINTLLDRLERYQGKIFVSNTLAYLTASKNGLSSVEMEDVLSLDEFVLNDVFQHWLPPIRRIPPLLLPRLLDQLTSYVMQREANGTVVYYWYHHQFIFVARERYLSENHHKIYIHGMLAHYFLGTWGGGKGKPFRYSQKQIQLMSTRNREVESKADRKVPLQPLQFGPDPLDPTVINYNLRKLSELPYHLLEGRQINDLKQEVLLNYSFLHAKLTALSLHDILSDFRMAIESGMTDPEVQLVYGALRVSGTYVNQNPNTLAFDLLGRLLVYYNDKLGIRNLLQQCDLKSLVHSSLLPLYQCFESPRATLLYVLEEHLQFAVDLLFTTHDLISIARDGTIMFWDLSMGECTMSIKLPGAAESGPLGLNTKLYVSYDSKYLVVDSDVIGSPVYVYDLKTAQLLHMLGRRSPNQRRGFLVGHYMCRQKSIIDISQGVEVCTVDRFVQSKRYLICTITPDQRSMLIGEELQTKMFDIQHGTLLATFPSENAPALFHVTEDSKVCYVGNTEDCLFKVLDIDRFSRTLGNTIYTYNYKVSLSSYSSRLLEGSKYSCEVAEIAVSPLDENEIVLNIRKCNLVWLNVNTKESKLLDIKPVFEGRTIKPNDINFFSVTFTFDGKHIVVGDDCYLHIWNMQKMDYVCSIQLHSTVRFPFAVSRNQNLVACGSTMHTAIKVWDLNKLHVKDAMEVKVYESPLDLISVAPLQRFAFVKKYYSISKGYQYVDSFGIDVWNVSTGCCSTFLSFGKYGKLLQMEVSSDGAHMALLLSVRDTYVSVFNMKAAKILCNIEVSSCYSISPSNKWDYLVTCSNNCSNNVEVKEIRLWSISRQGEFIVLFSRAHSPVFTLDGNYLLYIDSGQTLISYNLNKMAPDRFVSLRADVLIPLPLSHKLVLTQTCTTRRQSLGSSSTLDLPEPPPEVAVWDFSESKCVCRLYGTSSTGIRDVSKDGRLAVNGRLQVFDLSTGEMVTQLGQNSRRSTGTSVPKTSQQVNDSSVGRRQEDDGDEEGTKEWNFVRLTYDGKYVIYVDDMSIQVSSVATGKLVAHASTHERVTSLQLMDQGYVLVLGREDGRLLMMKLIGETMSLMHHPDSLDARVDFILRGMAPKPDPRENPDALKLDEAYQLFGQFVKDTDVPKASEAIRAALSSRAKVPHAVITTPKSISSSHLNQSAGYNSSTLPTSASSGSLGDLTRFSRQNTSPLNIEEDPRRAGSGGKEAGRCHSGLMIDVKARHSRYPTHKTRGSTDDVAGNKRRSSVDKNGGGSTNSMPPSPTYRDTPTSYNTPVLTPFSSRLNPQTPYTPHSVFSSSSSQNTDSPLLLKPPTGLNPSTSRDNNRSTSSYENNRFTDDDDDEVYTPSLSPHSVLNNSRSPPAVSGGNMSSFSPDMPLSGVPALSPVPGYTHRSSSIPNLYTVTGTTGRPKKKGSTENLLKSGRSSSTAPGARVERPASATSSKGGFLKNLFSPSNRRRSKPPIGKSKDSDRKFRDDSRDRMPSV